jgi:hypothetical protein
MATEKRLIWADETVDAFTKWLTSTYDGRMPADIVNEIPTVDAVEVVHGEYRTKILCGGSYEEWGYVCSVCGCTVSDRSKLSFGKFARGNQKLNYCPNCGADMRERKDNEN